MKLRNIITLISGIALMASCVEEQELPKSSEVFHAQMEEFNTQSKTSLGYHNSVVWSQNDCISIFAGSTRADRYMVTDECAGTPNGEFHLYNQIPDNGFYSGNELHTNIAVYPYTSEHICYGPGLVSDNNSYMVSGVEFKSTQYYSANSFPENTFVMMAVTNGTEDTNLKFKNVSGAFKLSLIGSGEISRLTLIGNSGEILAGKANIIGGQTITPSYEFTDNLNGHITLECENAVFLNQYEPTVFMMTVPPTNFENGFTVIVEDKQGNTQELSTYVPNEVRRSSILSMPTVEIQMPTDNYESVTIAESIARVNQGVEITGTVHAVGSRELMLSDDSANILVYYGRNIENDFSIGDVLSIRGQAKRYNYAFEFIPESSSYAYNEEVAYGDAERLDSEFIHNHLGSLYMYGGDKTAVESRYVEFEGSFIGSRYFKVKGNNELVNIYTSNTELTDIISNSQFKDVRIAGYTFHLSSEVYICIMPTSIEVIGNDEASVDVALGEQAYTVTGTVKAKCTRGYVVENEGVSTFVYCGAYYSDNYVIGDNVTATGLFKPFQHANELYWVYDIYNGHEDEVTFSTPEILTAEALDSYIESTFGHLPYMDSVIPTKYVELTGTLVIEGTDYNILVDGSAYKTNLFFPDAATKEFGNMANGEKVVFKGYMLKVTPKNYLTLMPSSLEKYNEEMPIE